MFFSLSKIKFLDEDLKKKKGKKSWQLWKMDCRKVQVEAGRLVRNVYHKISELGS